MIGSVKRETLGKVLNLPEHFNIALVIALGKPAETVVLEDAVDGAISNTTAMTATITTCPSGP